MTTSIGIAFTDFFGNSDGTYTFGYSSQGPISDVQEPFGVSLQVGKF